MDDLFIIQKDIMRSVIEEIKKLPVDCKNFDAADRWVGIVLILEKAFNAPKGETKAEMPEIQEQGA